MSKARRRASGQVVITSAFARRKSGSRRVADFHAPLRRAATRVYSIASCTGSAIWTRFGAALARFDPEGRIVTLDRQDRGLWDTREIAEGVRVLQSALAVQRPGRYQIEAAIAALHDDAASAEETDWPQILAWYDDLVALTDDPVRQDPAAVLGRAVAVGHVLGPAAGLLETDRLREVLGDRHRWHAVRGHLHELDGDLPAAATAYVEAARRATNVAERDHLVRRAARSGRPSCRKVVSLSVLRPGQRHPRTTTRSSTDSKERKFMTVQRLEHIGIVVDDLAAATAFFAALGLELEGEASVEGGSVDRINGLEGVRADIVMLRTPDGNGKVELAKYRSPSYEGDDGPAPANAPGIRHILFVVDDIEASLAGLRAHGGELVGELENYENSYWLCYVRGPAGIIVELAEKIG